MTKKLCFSYLQKTFVSLMIVVLLVQMHIVSILDFLGTIDTVHAASTLDCNTAQDVSVAECEALRDLYTSLDGDNWMIYNVPVPWGEQYPGYTYVCTRAGVQCDFPAGGSTGEVVGIDLRSNDGYRIQGLSGTLTDLSGLNHLNRLVIWDHVIQGTLSAGWSNLPIKTLDIRHLIQIQGTLPESRGNRTGLEKFHISDLDLTGSLPDSWSGWTNLTDFSLVGMNNLTGVLPESRGNRTNLSSFYMESIFSLTGTLPATWSGWTFLRNITLSSISGVQGTFPRDRSTWTNLASFTVKNLNIEGVLPSDRSAWSELHEFEVSNSQLTGTLPSSRSAWTSLKNFTLHSSRVWGELPPSRSVWNNISSFQVYDTPLVGNLPDNRSARGDTIQNFTIQGLYLTGSLPDSWSTWTQPNLIFSVIDVPLIGSLPSSWDSWSPKDFTVARTFIDGALPSNRGGSFGRENTIKTLVLIGNKISGDIPDSRANIGGSRAEFAGALSQNCLNTTVANSSLETYLNNYFNRFYYNGWTNQRDCSDSDIAINKTILSGNYVTGGFIDYQITYSNSGSRAWTGSIDDVLGTGLTFVSGHLNNLRNTVGYGSLSDVCIQQMITDNTGAYVQMLNDWAHSVYGVTGMYEFLLDPNNTSPPYTGTNTGRGSWFYDRINTLNPDHNPNNTSNVPALQEAYVDSVNEDLSHTGVKIGNVYLYTGYVFDTRPAFFMTIGLNEKTKNQDANGDNIYGSGIDLKAMTGCGGSNNQFKKIINIPPYGSGSFVVRAKINENLACGTSLSNTVTVHFSDPSFVTITCYNYGESTYTILPICEAGELSSSSYRRASFKRNVINPSLGFNSVLTDLGLNISLPNNFRKDKDLSNNSSTVTTGVYCAPPSTITNPPGGPICGDNIVNRAEEECDGGVDCTAQCKIMKSGPGGGWGGGGGGDAYRCGDNIVNRAEEECDGGVNCTAQCKKSTVVTSGPRCGNALVETGEQCDGGTNCTAQCTVIVPKPKPTQYHDAAPLKQKFILPEMIPKSGTPIDDLRAQGVKVLANKLVDVNQPERIRQRKQGEKIPTNISYRKSLLPDEQDRKAKKFVVLPRLGVVSPIVDIDNAIDYLKVLKGQNIIFNNYLSNGVLHYPGSATFGESGNAVLLGHSSYFYDDPGRFKTIFSSLPLMKTKDLVWIFEKNEDGSFTKYEYKITSSFETVPENVEVMGPKPGTVITLITCTPIGGVKGRWIVGGKLLSSTQDDSSLIKSKTNKNIKKKSK